MVHIRRRFNLITVHFPIRGHSYLECDRDMSNVKQDTRAELPSDWEKAILAARKYPAPYNIIQMSQGMFFRITDALKPRFRATCPVQTRPIRELRIDSDHPQQILHRETWGGAFEIAVVVRNTRQQAVQPEIRMKKAYSRPIPLSKAKFQDLQVLKKFCLPLTQRYFESLPTDNRVPDTEETVGSLQEQENQQ